MHQRQIPYASVGAAQGGSSRTSDLRTPIQCSAINCTPMQRLAVVGTGIHPRASGRQGCVNCIAPQPAARVQDVPANPWRPMGQAPQSPAPSRWPNAPGLLRATSFRAAWRTDRLRGLDRDPPVGNFHSNAAVGTVAARAGCRPGARTPRPRAQSCLQAGWLRARRYTRPRQWRTGQAPKSGRRHRSLHRPCGSARPASPGSAPFVDPRRAPRTPPSRLENCHANRLPARLRRAKPVPRAAPARRAGQPHPVAPDRQAHAGPPSAAGHGHRAGARPHRATLP